MCIKVRVVGPCKSAHVFCLHSFAEVPCVQTPALWQWVTQSPRLSTDDQDKRHTVHRWQVTTHTHLSSLIHPMPTHSVTPVAGGARGEKALSFSGCAASRPASDECVQYYLRESIYHSGLTVRQCFWIFTCPHQIYGFFFFVNLI